MAHMMRYPLLLGGLFLAASCTLAPVPDRGMLNNRFPERFQAWEDPRGAVKGEKGDEIRVEMRDKPGATWSDSFPDAALQADARSMGLHNYAVAAARSRVAQAAAAFGVQRSALFPSVDATTDVERRRIREEGSTSTDTLIAFGQALNWELDIWGRLQSRKEAAGLTLSEQSALADQTLLDLQTLLVETWLAYHTAVRLETVINRQQETNTRFLELTELRFAQGQGSALDVLQQRGRLKATQRELPGVVSRQQQAANAYAVLLGQMPGRAALPRADWPRLGPLVDLPAPDTLMMRRPDLRAAFLALLAADHEVAAAIADRLPRLSIGLGLSVSGDSLSNIGDAFDLGATAGLLAPVFDAGRRKAVVLDRQAQVSEALSDLEQAMHVAVQEVEDGLVAEKALFRELGLLDQEISHAGQTVAEARQSYVNGQGSYLNVLDALETYQTLLQEQVSLERDAALNRAGLLKALGASWGSGKRSENK